MVNNDNDDSLDLLFGLYLLALAPLFRRLRKKATTALKAVDTAASKTPVAKRKSKRYIQQAQQEFIKAVKNDMEQAKAAQDLYVTHVLSNTLKYSFYTMSFEMETVTGVRVNIPRLNNNGIVGKVCTDWVGDGHTFSDRIRANTDLVADSAKKVINKMLSSPKADSYEHAATELSRRIDESYNNAMRIVRTEMTRANALGASYAAMQNADLYEGKYRDATYDSRTSAMCAHDADYSRANPYPLDYDTPANPGVPGARIPNHPNCRCRWQFIPKGGSVSNRGKLARKGDNKSNYGEIYYTHATTYDDYAKERGLPSVKEMLEKDNPKRYLRPGETLDELKKELKSVKSGAKNAPLFIKDLDSSGKSGIIKVKGVNDMYSGGLSGALNPNSERAMQHAERYYAEVRKMSTDCKKIAQNTGWKEDSILQIKDHLFYKKHDLGGPEAEYFDADYDIAVSWQNLIEGRIEAKDLVLLKHEYLELHIMKSKNLPYAEAHKLAEEKHNYGKALKEWRAKL